jgi:hypothetical protein
MSYIGNTNTTQAFTPAVDFFNGDASTTAFTLSRPVASVAQVQAVVNNVPQKPFDAFTVSGNTITFTSAPSSGTNNIYVYYTSPITQVVAPSTGTVGLASFTASGTPSASTFLRGDNSWQTVSVTPTAISDQLNSSTGYFDLPAGTTAQRPGSPVVGMIRYNSDEGQYEVYHSGSWKLLSVAGYTYSIEYIVVAGGAGGGGGGGYEAGGGGGAGGYITSTATVAVGFPYTVTIGAGGAATGAGGAGPDGFASSFSGSGVSLTTVGGGGGAGSNQVSRGGGSGGGGSNWSQRGGAAGTAGQGNAGGTGGTLNSPSGQGGGGGGKGAVGNSPGIGGVGQADTWTGSSRTLAGGGSGAGGYASGGGGGGATAVAGTANTGGGGGGTNSAPTTGGGSGIIIIRYLGAQRGSGGTYSSSGGYSIHTFTTSTTYSA